MTGIYIASTTQRAGKSLLAFSLGVLLQKRGCSVAYMKPVGRLPQTKDGLPGDADALVVQEVLGQNAAADLLTPVMTPAGLHALALEDADGSALERIGAGYDLISQGKDLTLVSGSGAFPAAGRFAGADGLTLVRKLGLKVLLIERYKRGINHDELLLLGDLLGEALIGLVLNDVPEDTMRDVKSLLVPWLTRRGLPVLGVLPHEPDLMAMRVLDIAHGLEGRVVAGNAQTARMVSGFLIGAMQVDNFMMHLRRKPGCAVIVGGDRSDLQLAALHADAPCIILTGNIQPPELIRARAEATGVTLIMVR
ncbi:AAA family ATPase, partial [Desulfovibrio sp. OttesenSCG-928-G11]|nr:AAA family ATPase [Desulfovibrio sp. OttesenSCG-928-G11]